MTMLASALSRNKEDNLGKGMEKYVDREVEKYVRSIDLDQIYSVEEILTAVGKSIVKSKVRDIPHPRRAFALIGAYEAVFRYELEDKDVSENEYKRCLSHLEDFDADLKAQTDPNKIRYMKEIKKASRHAGQRLKYLELGDRSSGRELKRLRELEQEEIKNAGKYLKFTEGISDGALSVATGTLTFAATDEPLYGLVVSAITLVSRVGKYIANKMHDFRVKRIRKNYAPEIEELQNKIHFHRQKIMVQTVLEWVNELDECVPGSVRSA